MISRFIQRAPVLNYLKLTLSKIERNTDSPM